jgi:hypothetical protein
MFRSRPEADGSVLVETLAVGICGTDHEIISGDYGEAPPGDDYLVLGHESLGRVVEAPEGSGFADGDLVVGIVRRPDPVPCANCAVGEWDMCRNGRYTERGIKGRHGYAGERYRIHPEFAVKLAPDLDRVGVLLEPTRPRRHWPTPTGTGWSDWSADGCRCRTTSGRSSCATTTSRSSCSSGSDRPVRPLLGPAREGGTRCRPGFRRGCGA